MKSEWKVYSVQELIDLDMLEEPMDGNHGGIHPKSSDYVSSGVPFIMANNLSNGKVDYDNCAFISEQQATTLRKGFAHPGDVLLTHKATIGRTAIVGDECFIRHCPSVLLWLMRTAALKQRSSSPCVYWYSD